MAGPPSRFLPSARARSMWSGIPSGSPVPDMFEVLLMSVIILPLMVGRLPTPWYIYRQRRRLPRCHSAKCQGVEPLSEDAHVQRLVDMWAQVGGTRPAAG